MRRWHVAGRAGHWHHSKTSIASRGDEDNDDREDEVDDGAQAVLDTAFQDGRA
jgi:hypothetical protein